ncbi:uncharacterized protein LOC117341641 [Pecten maximus]|uniref:uncharacterized protein LOC117341641 n=1 Tax=Pecten maximus TaxID=6579 RepID=UPI001458021A|nr:uncharacterized protein LOC117341641 [Pecten maximus]
MSDRQIGLLEKTRTWYMDGTFRMVNEPWTQLFSMHGFVKSDDNMKQIHLAFCFMSGKREEDYYAVLRAIDRMLPSRRLERCVVDFEAGLWQAIRRRFHDVKIQGCAFHWTQAVYRKVQELGLKKAYEEHGKVYCFLSEVMALHFLPREHIFVAFDSLREEASSGPLLDLMIFIERTWMMNRLASGPTTTWKGGTIAWNSRVNTKGPVPLYLLIQELFRKTASIPLQLRLVDEVKLKRFQRKRAQKSQRRLFKLWKEYERQNLSTSKFLRKAASLLG